MGNNEPINWRFIHLRKEGIIFCLLQHLKYRDLFNKIYLNRLIVGSVLSFMNQWCGINAINFYSITVFEDIADGNFIWINILTVLDGVSSILASLITGYFDLNKKSSIINRYGRRIMFLFGNGVCTLSLSLLAVLYFTLDIN